MFSFPDIVLPAIVSGIFLIVVTGFLNPFYSHYLSSRGKKLTEAINLRESLSDSKQAKRLNPIIYMRLNEYIAQNRMTKISKFYLLLIGLASAIQNLFLVGFLTSALDYQFDIEESLNNLTSNNNRIVILFPNLYDMHEGAYITITLISVILIWIVKTLFKRKFEPIVAAFGATFKGGQYETRPGVVMRVLTDVDPLDLNEKLCSDLIYIYDFKTHSIHVYEKYYTYKDSPLSNLSGVIPISKYRYLEVIPRDDIEKFDDKFYNPVMSDFHFKYAVEKDAFGAEEFYEIFKPVSNVWYIKIMIKIIDFFAFYLSRYTFLKNNLRGFFYNDYLEFANEKRLYAYRYINSYWWEARKNWHEVYREF